MLSSHYFLINEAEKDACNSSVVLNIADLKTQHCRGGPLFTCMFGLLSIFSKQLPSSRDLLRPPFHSQEEIRATAFKTIGDFILFRLLYLFGVTNKLGEANAARSPRNRVPFIRGGMGRERPSWHGKEDGNLRSWAGGSLSSPP